MISGSLGITWLQIIKIDWDRDSNDFWQLNHRQDGD